MTRTKRHGFCGSSVRNVTAFADLWTACMDEPQETLPHFPLFSRDGKGAASSPEVEKPRGLEREDARVGQDEGGVRRVSEQRV